MSGFETAPRFQRILSHVAKALLVYAAAAAPIDNMPTCTEQLYQADSTEQGVGLEGGSVNDLLINDSLSIVTDNIKSGERGIQEVADELAQQEPDVICTQETVASNVDPILKATGVSHRAVAWASESDGQPFGNVTFSDSEIIDSYTIPLPRIYDEQRSLLVTTHQRDGEKFYVLNTHLTPKNATALVEGTEDTQISERDLQAIYVMKELNSLPATDPAFFCGDLNARPGSSTYNEMTGGRFIDGVTAVGDKTLETFAGSDVQIDYILNNGQKWLLSKVRTFGERQTDHCGVEGEFIQLAETETA